MKNFHIRCHTPHGSGGHCEDCFLYCCCGLVVQEGEEGVIRLHCDENDVLSDDPVAVGLMIDYLYRLDYTVRLIQLVTFQI